MRCALLPLTLLAGCSFYADPPAQLGQAVADAVTQVVSPATTLVADVEAVTISGQTGAYTFSVRVASPDTGCDQYADWWEVLNVEGDLLYRRVLLHSHVNEQPFTRSGGPVDIAPEQSVWVRAHMHPAGYGGTVFKGTVADGFTATPLSPAFAAEVAEQAPLPVDCDF